MPAISAASGSCFSANSLRQSLALNSMAAKPPIQSCIVGKSGLGSLPNHCQYCQQEGREDHPGHWPGHVQRIAPSVELLNPNLGILGIVVEQAPLLMLAVVSIQDPMSSFPPACRSSISSPRHSLRFKSIAAKPQAQSRSSQR